MFTSTIFLNKNKDHYVVIELRNSSFVLDTDTVTAPTLTISKNGGSFVALFGPPAITNIAAGHWRVLVDNEDLNCSYVVIKATKTGMVTQTVIIYLLDEIETGYSIEEAMRLVLSSAAGKLSGAGTATVQIRDIRDTKNRITGSIDSIGNRSTVLYDVT